MPNRSPLTESPWYWVYLFATGALIALALMSRKYDHRQAEIEREFSARQRHGYIVSDDRGPIEAPKPGRQLIRLQPLFVMFSLIFMGGWVLFWYQRSRSGARRAESLPDREMCHKETLVEDHVDHC
jgi:hypothetical protein